MEQDDTDETIRSDNIVDVTAHLQSLLVKKGKELNEREEAFQRRLRLFESDNPTVGNDNDVLHLNVGGNANIAVLRRTLTQFEDSMLAVKFSGRWDESLEKDRDGNFFIDQDSEIFLLLIKYLRRCDQKVGDIPVRSPPPTYDFCWMLQYYDLMPALYPQKWDCKWGDFTEEKKSYGTMVLTSKNPDSDTGFATALCDMGTFFVCGVSEFTVHLEKGSLGYVGWYYYKRGGTHKITNEVLANCTREGRQQYEYTMLLDISRRKIVSRTAGGSINPPVEVINIDQFETGTKVTCRYDGKLGYSIEVAGATPRRVSATLCGKNKLSYDDYRPYPMISFSGKVTISGFKYAIQSFPS